MLKGVFYTGTILGDILNFFVTKSFVYPKLGSVKFLLLVLAFCFLTSVQQKSMLPPVFLSTAQDIHSHELESETLGEMAEAFLTGGFNHDHSHEDSPEKAAHSHSHQHTFVSGVPVTEFISSTFSFLLYFPKQVWTSKFTLPDFNSFQSELLRPPISRV